MLLPIKNDTHVLFLNRIYRRDIHRDQFEGLTFSVRTFGNLLLPLFWLPGHSNVLSDGFQNFQQCKIRLGKLEGTKKGSEANFSDFFNQNPEHF